MHQAPGNEVRLVVLASGTGSTLQTLLDDDVLGASIVAAGTDRRGSQAMQRAHDAGLATFALGLDECADRAAWNDALADLVAAHEPHLVVLAGFMRVLAPSFVARFRIVNTHPALLPAHPGAHAIHDALAAGDRQTGVTVHWVDDGVDTGPVIAQVEVPIVPGDDEDTLRVRIQAAERPLYVDTVRKLCEEIA